MTKSTFGFAVGFSFLEEIQALVQPAPETADRQALHAIHHLLIVDLLPRGVRAGGRAQVEPQGLLAPTANRLPRESAVSMDCGVRGDLITGSLGNRAR